MTRNIELRLVDKGKNIILHRTFTKNTELSSTSYTAPQYFSFGTGNDEVLQTDTTFNNPIPLNNGGIIDDGTTTWTGSKGGHDSTNNTTTYKEGAGATDNTAQNLNCDNIEFTVSTIDTVNDTISCDTTNFYDNMRCKFSSGVLPTGLTNDKWYYMQNVVNNVSGTFKLSETESGSVIDLTDTGTAPINFLVGDNTNIWQLSVSGIDNTKYTGLWLYCGYLTTNPIINFKTDASNYFTYTTNLVQGWNWIDVGILENLTTIGTPSTISTIEIIYTFELLDQENVDVKSSFVVDLIRQWELMDTRLSPDTGYPVIDYDTNNITTRVFLDSLTGVGYVFDCVNRVNNDTNPMLFTKDIIRQESKGSTDEFTIINKDRL
jgi:hypothetical protein